ncbi:MAG: rod shape-determining protein MreD [Pleurocapsa sp.]
MPRRNKTYFDTFKILNIALVIFSLIVCIILMLFRIPGIELLGTSPNWLLIWLIAWSLKKSIWQGAIAGLLIGWVYDAITLAVPSHTLAFIIVGICTARIQKQKYTGEDFISVAFVVFFMTILAETIFALQYLRIHWLSISQVLPKYQQTAIISAIITSLWSPIFYYPFNFWQRRIKQWQKRAIK